MKISEQFKNAIINAGWAYFDIHGIGKANDEIHQHVVEYNTGASCELYEDVCLGSAAYDFKMEIIGKRDGIYNRISEDGESLAVPYVDIFAVDDTGSVTRFIVDSYDSSIRIEENYKSNM